MHHHDDIRLSDDDLQIQREVGDAELAGMGITRRTVLQTGLAALAAAGIAEIAPSRPANAAVPQSGPADPSPDSLTWLVGDHHVHTQWSYDAKYRIADQLDAAQHHGCDWIAFTEHPRDFHADAGVLTSHDLIAAERRRRPDMLIFQGIEWYIPAAEHGTVLVHGKDEAEILRQFELVFDGYLNGWQDTPANSPEQTEQTRKAAAAIAWLGQMKKDGHIDDALVLANHPMRKGIDGPGEIRQWNDADPDIMIGMEGAPGAQGYGYGRNVGDGDRRGEYVNKPKADSWPGYTTDMMRTYGGWDWLTATVGGFWDSMLAEGRRFFITANSDAHLYVWHTWRLGDYPDRAPFNQNVKEDVKMTALGGRRPDPIDTRTEQTAGPLLVRDSHGHPAIAGDIVGNDLTARDWTQALATRDQGSTMDTQGGSDFWPGQFTRIHTGVTERSYRGVMEALRSGRVWADHGHLLAGFDVRATAPGQDDAVTLGGELVVHPGDDVTITMTVTPTTEPTRHIRMDPATAESTDPRVGVDTVPQVAFIDIIGGPITGAAADPQTLRAPRTTVLKSFDTRGRTGRFTLTHTFAHVTESFYVRFRGSDGRQNGVGYHGAQVDPRGPVMGGERAREADPWKDLWFYANPIFISVDTGSSPSPSQPARGSASPSPSTGASPSPSPSAGAPSPRTSSQSTTSALPQASSPATDPTQGARNATSSSTTSEGSTPDDQQPRQLPDTGQ
ncbi:Histidinol phosphatase and related hydrolases of the PHP family [Cutibacterium granulosum]|uniref:Histidinol phosphatase and related hydrolases of the PHP family n=1 Tax=Cutibacterium granulosum TaxID=33011 RepID=A0A239WC58_9ACTN|nr:PHP domain-containing protein [Cutibacterium granulosum]KAG9059325.1 PHP domain-containing protein [Cutibacterium granulosum DSM 20700]SNV31518.1 Histidinol phosphatase and related hydrolases of the PHP family [Cutibacterium granulosum]